MSVQSIAKLLNRSRKTTYKEIKYGTTTKIKQNKKKIMYLTDIPKLSMKTQTNSKKPFKILQSFDFVKYIQEKFYNNHWSLDSIF